MRSCLHHDRALSLRRDTIWRVRVHIYPSTATCWRWMLHAVLGFCVIAVSAASTDAEAATPAAPKKGQPSKQVQRAMKIQPEWLAPYKKRILPKAPHSNIRGCVSSRGVRYLRKGSSPSLGFFIVGTRGTDIICGTGGSDDVVGLAGDDKIRVGANTSGLGDKVLPGEGRDEIEVAAAPPGPRAESLSSYAFVRPGRVRDYGSVPGITYYTGGTLEADDGAGDDIIVCRDKCYADGGVGDDIILATNLGPTGSLLFGGRGNDYISAHGGRVNQIDGGPGNDVLKQQDVLTLTFVKGGTGSDLAILLDGDRNDVFHSEPKSDPTIAIPVGVCSVTATIAGKPSSLTCPILGPVSASATADGGVSLGVSDPLFGNSLVSVELTRARVAVKGIASASGADACICDPPIPGATFRTADLVD